MKITSILFLLSGAMVVTLFNVAQAQEARQLAGKMVAIPEGSFLMGDLGQFDPVFDRHTRSGWMIEIPIRHVSLDSFWMGVHEVTVGQFRAFVEDSGYRTDAETNKSFQGCLSHADGRLGHRGNDTSDVDMEYHAGHSWRSPAPGFVQGEDHPVVCVSYNDAHAFIDWLNKKTGQHYRLPTEAEWEYAVRAGTETNYYFGDRFSHDENCYVANLLDGGLRQHYWYGRCSDGYKYTAPVGSFPPNPFGLYDMIGNVAEIVEDFFGYYDMRLYSMTTNIKDGELVRAWSLMRKEDFYSKSPVYNPQGPSSGNRGVFRGGHWLIGGQVGEDSARSSSRGYSAVPYSDGEDETSMDNSGRRTYVHGFRLVRQPLRAGEKVGKERRRTQ